MKNPVYLDYAATTPVDPRVATVMSGCLTRDGIFANPASRSHVYGWQAEERVELSREQVATLVGADTREIIWTSGATESNNLALKGVFEALDFSGHLVTTEIEHKSVLDTAAWLQTRGVEVTRMPPDADGRVTVSALRDALRPDTRLVSVMLVNNETGAVNPVAEMGVLCRQLNIPLHVDAAQAIGRMECDVEDLQADLLSLSAHKFYGPKGIGALYVRRPMQRRVKAQMLGGGHERGLRSGTLPTHQIAGMGEAARLVSELLSEEPQRLALLRDRLWQGISHLPGVRRNGSAQYVSPAHLSVCFSGVDGEALLLAMRELAVSTGSACMSASIEPSYVLKAMGLSAEDAHSSIRFSLGRFTGVEEIQRAIDHIVSVLERLHATRDNDSRNSSALQ